MSSRSLAPSGVRSRFFRAEAAAPPRAQAKRFQLSDLTDYFLFDDCLTDPELGRRARLVVWFGLLGFVFGSFYAAFYFVIDHTWGVGIVALCSIGFLATPFLMRAFRSVAFGGNFLAGTMVLGFTGLCYVEGGLHGHAIAWLASIPLCALLLVGKRSAGVWVIIALAAAATLVAADISEIPIPVRYNHAWIPLVDSAGYLGLIAFMFGLGLIFERSREQAFGKMTDALQDVEASNQKLSIMNQEKNDFLGIAAHDLRNPLTIIINYAEIIRESHRPADAPKFANAIYDAGARMRDLISNLLDANAIEQGLISCKIERCAVAQLVAESVVQNQINATRKGTEIVTAIPPDLAVRSDHGTTIQILDNLISNALKYAPPKTRVAVEAAREGEEVRISVKDEGPGISEADQQKLFGKFTRLTARPTGGESSTGLGLSIVKRLAEAMQGSIKCHSVLGQGATFILRLPVWDGNLPAVVVREN